MTGQEISGKRAAGQRGGCPAILFVFLILAELCFLAPHFFNLITEGLGQYRIAAYREAALGMEAEEQESGIEEALQYNRQVAENQQYEPFSYQGEEASDPEYENLLNFGDDGIMGFIDIPAAGIFLPIVHGTKSEQLKYACGHMYGTSLPVGGISSKAVLAGHTGLPAAELFTNLTKLAVGDSFDVCAGGERFMYRVSDIKVVLPEEEARYLQIEKGRDLVTLYTCTPYGINDHRLLVTGERIHGDAAEARDDELRLDSRVSLTALRAVLCVSPVIFTAAAGAACCKKKRRKRRSDE